MSKRFDYLMLAIEVGGSRKYRRLTPPERWATVAGVFSLAAKSPISGALLVAYGEEATELDVAEQAGVPVTVARSALRKLRDLHELVRDDTIGAWVIEDWTRHQPKPSATKPSDTADSTRERKQKQRAKERANSHADVTRVTQPEVTPGHAEEENRREEQNSPPCPPSGGFPPLPTPPPGKRATDVARFEAQVAEYAAARFPDVDRVIAAGLVQSAISWVPQPATEESVETFVRQHSAASDEPGLGDAERTLIAEAGARTVELNERATA